MRKPMMNLKGIVLLAVAATVFFSSCKEDNVEESLIPANAAFVINEGNFQSGNASIDVYDPDEGTVQNGVFQSVNGVPLGDVGQSMFMNNGKGYVVVNNSGKIEVLDLNSFESITTISGLSSPRYIYPVTTNKAYVTDLFSGAVSILDLNTDAITGTINISGWTERTIAAEGNAFITISDTNFVVVVDPVNDAVTDTLNVVKGPNSMVVDANGKLWVLCDGGFMADVPALFRFDPATLQVETSITLGSAADSPSGLQIDDSGTQLYFLMGGAVYSMGINGGTLPSSPLVDGSGKTFYDYSLRNTDNTLYVTDAVDYTQAGNVFIYDASNGTVIDSFDAGIIPGEVIFR